jgi:hypothetical protein
MRVIIFGHFHITNIDSSIIKYLICRTIDFQFKYAPLNIQMWVIIFGHLTSLGLIAGKQILD